MKSRLLLLLLLFVAAMMTPSLRAQILPRVGPYVEPVVKPVRDPVYTWSASSRVKEIARKLQANMSHGGSLPEPRLFTAYLRGEYQGADGALDAWGTPIHLQINPTEARVVSAGRDQVLNTADDIVSGAIPLQR